MTFSNLVLNPTTREVVRGTRVINLTRTEIRAAGPSRPIRGGCWSGPGY